MLPSHVGSQPSPLSFVLLLQPNKQSNSRQDGHHNQRYAFKSHLCLFKSYKKKNKKVKYEENCGKRHVTLEQSLETVHTNILTCLCALSPQSLMFPFSKTKGNARRDDTWLWLDGSPLVTYHLNINTILYFRFWSVYFPLLCLDVHLTSFSFWQKVYVRYPDSMLLQSISFLRLSDQPEACLFHRYSCTFLFIVIIRVHVWFPVWMDGMVYEKKSKKFCGQGEKLWNDHSYLNFFKTNFSFQRFNKNTLMGIFVERKVFKSSLKPFTLTWFRSIKLFSWVLRQSDSDNFHPITFWHENFYHLLFLHCIQTL